MRITVPLQVVDKIDLAHVCFHEAGHTAGITHADTEGCPVYRRVGNYRELHSRTESLPLEKQEPGKKRKPVSDQLADAEQMLARAQRRAKLSTTIDPKWKRRAVALRRTAAAPANALPLAANGVMYQGTEKYGRRPGTAQITVIAPNNENVSH
jgi:hypothetical protein